MDTKTLFLAWQDKDACQLFAVGRLDADGGCRSTAAATSPARAGSRHPRAFRRCPTSPTLRVITARTTALRPFATGELRRVGRIVTSTCVRSCCRTTPTRSLFCPSTAAGALRISTRCFPNSPSGRTARLLPVLPEWYAACAKSVTGAGCLLGGGRACPDHAGASRSQDPPCRPDPDCGQPCARLGTPAHRAGPDRRHDRSLALFRACSAVQCAGSTTKPPCPDREAGSLARTRAHGRRRFQTARALVGGFRGSVPAFRRDAKRTEDALPV